MRARCSLLAAVVPLVFVVGQACSGSQSGGRGTAVGGGSGVGGESQGGASGGSTNVGGQSSGTSTGGASTGGSLGSGGALGTGGAMNTGGVATGGATSTGGADATGGKSVGASAATGGATGGAAPNGGAKATGGTPATGGVTSAGGAVTTGGISGIGGGSGTPVCATAAEGSKATLTCPTGQIISSVTFASFGAPTGTCGSFAKGSCDALSSQTVVNSICLGRNSCSVPATNPVFSDPCNSTVKSLSIQATCAPGTPVIGATSPYKGVANSPASEIATLGATWCYNWGINPQTTDCANPLFVPMIWGSSNVASAIQSIGNAGYKTVLAFNEPNKSDQSNMTVAAALALWPTLTSNPNIRVGSPAVSDDGRAWLVDFMTQARTQGLRVDFIAMHWYGWNAGSCTASQLEGAVNWAQQWGLPVWITEFGCMGSSNPDEQTLISFYNGAVTMLRNHPMVERYAWYPWNTYNDLYLDNSSGVRAITALGQAFQAAPQYQQ